MKKKKILITTILITILLAIIAITLDAISNTMETIYLDSLQGEDKYYCIMHGITFSGGTYQVYETGDITDNSKISTKYAYLVKQRIDHHDKYGEHTKSEYDLISNAIWYFADLDNNNEFPQTPDHTYATDVIKYWKERANGMGDSWNWDDDLAPLIKEAEYAEKIYNIIGNGDIQVDINDTCVTKTNNEYGPFQIQCPTMDEKDIAGTLTIKVNQNIYTPSQNQLKYNKDKEKWELYINETNISQNSTNTIEIEYKATVVKGTYKLLKLTLPTQHVVYIDPTETEIQRTDQLTFTPQEEDDNFHIKLIKKDDSTPAKKIQGIKFKVEDVWSNETISLEETTDSNGEIMLKFPESYALYDYFSIKITEELTEDQKRQYTPIGPIDVLFTKTDGKWTPSINQQNEVVILDKGTNTITLEVTNKKTEQQPPDIKLHINKYDSDGVSCLNGATFSINVNNGTAYANGSPISEFTMDSIVTGYRIITIKPENTNKVTVTLAETVAPPEHEKLSGNIVIEYTYNNGTWTGTLTENADSHAEFKDINNEVQLCVYNEKEEDDTITLNLKKYDEDGKTLLPNMVFNVKVIRGTSNVTKITTNSKGEATLTVKPDADATDVVVQLTEAESTDFIKMNQIDIMFTRSSTTDKKWVANYTKTDQLEISQDGDTTNLFILNIRNKRPIDLTLVKKDEDGNYVDGIIFDVNVEGGTSNKQNIITGKDGKGKLIITPNNKATTITVTLTERDSEDYIKISPITIEYTYTGEGWMIETLKTNNSEDQKLISGESGKNNKFTITATNNKKTSVNFNLIKVKANSDICLPGVQFKITFEENAKTGNGETTVVREVQEEGVLYIEEGIVIDDITKDVKIIIEETTEPKQEGVRYLKLEQTEITFNYTTGKCTSNNDLVSVEYDNKTKMLKTTVQNIAVIDISGKVWLDAQTGIKPVSAPNNLYDDGEELIDDVQVILHKVSSSDGKILESKYTSTKDGGKYAFTDLPISKDWAYRVEFMYEGIHYQAVKQDWRK